MTVLDNVSFCVSKGRIHGLLGPNGAGKSTTMKIIAGLLSPSKGEVKVEGSVGILPEYPPLYPHMQVGDYLEFVAAIYGVSKYALKKRTADLMDQCGLLSVVKRRIGNLSKGFKQRLGIAQAMAGNPDILIFDEPTSGLDPLAIEDIRSLILSLRGEHTILLSSHLLHEVDLLCSEMTIIHRGKILQTGDVDKLGKDIQSRQVIEVELADWNTELEEEMKRHFALEYMEQKKGNGFFDMTFYFNQDEDMRDELGRFFIEKNCGLLSFKKKRLNVEEIFHLTAGDR